MGVVSSECPETPFRRFIGGFRGNLLNMAPEEHPGHDPGHDETVSEASAGLPSNAPDLVIGPYHLLRIIGEGGMGEVWLAEQTQPVRRRVAIKLIKAGMDTREVVARLSRNARRSP